MSQCPHCGADLQQVQHIVNVIVKDTAIVSCKECSRRIVITPAKSNAPDEAANKS